MDFVKSLVGWAFQPNNETDLDAKMQRGEEAESVSGEDTKLLRHYGTKVVSEIAAIYRHSESLEY